MADNPPRIAAYEEVCKYVGHFFIESRHREEQLSREVITARQQRDQALRERDEALGLLHARKGAE